MKIYVNYSGDLYDLLESPYDTVPLDKVIKLLEKFKEEHPEAALNVGYDYAYVQWRCLETDEEYNNRITREAMNEAANEKWERETLERLKKKYEDG